MATISKIHVDVYPQEDADAIKRPSETPQLAVACQQDEKKQPSDPRTHVKPPRKPDRKVSNGFRPFRDTFSVVEKKVAANDDKEDTMELLKDANMPGPKLEVEHVTDFEKKAAHQISLENVEANMKCKNDSPKHVNGASTRQADVQVSSVINNPIVCWLFVGGPSWCFVAFLG